MIKLVSCTKDNVFIITSWSSLHCPVIEKCMGREIRNTEVLCLKHRNDSCNIVLTVYGAKNTGFNCLLLIWMSNITTEVDPSKKTPNTQMLFLALEKKRTKQRHGTFCLSICSNLNLQYKIRILCQFSWRMVTLPMWEIVKRKGMYLRLNIENETHSDQGLRCVIIISEFWKNK